MTAAGHHPRCHRRRILHSSRGAELSFTDSYVRLTRSAHKNRHTLDGVVGVAADVPSRLGWLRRARRISRSTAQDALTR